MTKTIKQKSAGFTLIEVIITLVVVAVVGTMLYTTLGSPVSQSSVPISRLQKSFELHQIIENFVTAYEKYYAGDLDALKTAIGAEGAAMNNTYGQYTVVENRYIKFVSNVEQQALATDTHNLLKVTIKNSNNETLTYIFAG